jgi:hypothetical protein
MNVKIHDLRKRKIRGEELNCTRSGYGGRERGGVWFGLVCG